MTKERTAKVFERARFGSNKEWIYFCLEYDLQLCDGCLGHARKRETQQATWYCDSCQPVVHPDLIQAVRTKQNILTACDLCAEQVPLSDCWISEDCQRLYCSAHLRPLAEEDRKALCPTDEPDEQAAPAAGRWHVRESNSTLDPLLPRRQVRTPSPITEAIYDGSRLVEFDRSQRWVM